MNDKHSNHIKAFLEYSRRTAADLLFPRRCPVCGGGLGIWGRALRCAKNHSFDMAREGYVNLLPIQKRHAADPGDGKAMVAARRTFLQSGAYDPFRRGLGDRGIS